MFRHAQRPDCCNVASCVCKDANSRQLRVVPPRETLGGMNTANPFDELAAIVGSARKAARMLGMNTTRYHRLRHSSVPVRFSELDQVRIALSAVRRAETETIAEDAGRWRNLL